MVEKYFHRVNEVYETCKDKVDDVGCYIRGDTPTVFGYMSEGFSIDDLKNMSVREITSRQNQEIIMRSIAKTFEVLGNGTLKAVFVPAKCVAKSIDFVVEKYYQNKQR